MSRLYLLEISKILIYYHSMIGKNSTKLIFTLPKTLYSQLKQEAEEHGKSLGSHTYRILQEERRFIPHLKKGVFSPIPI